MPRMIICMSDECGGAMVMEVAYASERMEFEQALSSKMPRTRWSDLYTSFQASVLRPTSHAQSLLLSGNRCQTYS